MSIREVFQNSEEYWRIEPSPSWVESWEPDWEFEAPAGSDVALLLVDEQQHVPSHSISNRIVRRLLSPRAVQTFCEAEIQFDAKSQRLRIHDLSVWRKDQAGRWHRHPLAGAVPFAAQPMEGQTGRVRVTARIEGLQEGDAIDLSWTLVPVVSLLGDPFTTFHGFVWSVPCGLTHFSIHPDPAVAIKRQLHCPVGVEKPEEDAGSGRLHWRQFRPPITRLEPHTPPGVWNFPVLEASGWRDWNAVAERTHGSWAQAMADGSSEILEAVRRLQSGRDRTEAISEAIRFVQDRIGDLDAGARRGVGLMANGAGSVLRRGSGDAKDKALLLTTLLRSLGVEAWPLLVNPDWQDTLQSLLPSFAVFNHVIVTFLADGRRYFADPSEASQRGDYAQWVQPSYGFGLEVKPGAAALIPLPAPPRAELILRETFHLDRSGQSGAVDQVLRATHWLAEEMRESIEREGEASFIQAHVEALQQQFPSLSSGDRRPDLREDPVEDAIEMRGRYALPTWGKPGEAPPAKFDYRASGLFLAVDWVEQAEERTVARALPHPMRAQHVVQVEAKGIRPGKPETRVHTGPGFRYRCEVTWEPGQVTFDHVWESTASRVEAAEWPEYCRGVNQVLGLVETSVSTPSAWFSVVTDRPALLYSLLGVGLVGILGTIGLMTGLVPWGEPESAVSRGMGLSQAPPRAVQAKVEKAVEAVSHGDFTSAAPLLEKEQAHYEEDPAFQLMRAEVAIRTGQLDRAEEALEQAKTLDPSNVSGDILTALLQREKGEGSSAKEILLATIKRSPNDPRPLRELAIMLAQEGAVQGASEAWARVLELNPGDADALRQYAVLLWQNGLRERADALIASALASQSSPNAAIEAAAGDYYTLTGRRAEALDRLEKAASLSPGDRTRDFALASGHLRLGRTQEAAELAGRLTREFPSDVRPWQVLAVAKSILGDQPGAEAAYREWLRLAPQDPNGPANFGFFLHQTGRNQEARELFAKCTDQFPNEGVIWLNYSAVLEALGEAEPAAAAKRRATELLTAGQKQLLIR